MKSNDDLVAAMAGGNPAPSNAVTKTKRTASIGTTASSLDKPKTTAGISHVGARCSFHASALGIARDRGIMFSFSILQVLRPSV